VNSFNESKNRIINIIFYACSLGLTPHDHVASAFRSGSEAWPEPGLNTTLAVIQAGSLLVLLTLETPSR
jgi:hypothetical protein